MRCLGRYILNGLTGLSLLLCVGACVLWVRGLWLSEGVRYSHGRAGMSRDIDAIFTVYSCRGAVGFRRENPATTPGAPPGWEPWSHPLYAPAGEDEDEYQWTAPGVRLDPVKGVELRAWLACGLFAVGPAARLYQWWRRRWKAARDASRCPTCGYDLRATPARCPECGTLPPCGASGGTSSTG